MTNMNTRSTWERGEPIESNGKKVLRQPVWVQTRSGGRRVEAEYDFFTNQLLTPQDTLLLSDSPSRQRLQTPQVKLLTEGGDEIVSSEEAAQIRTSVAGFTTTVVMPENVLTDVEKFQADEQRRQLLRKQLHHLQVAGVEPFERPIQPEIGTFPEEEEL